MAALFALLATGTVGAQAPQRVPAHLVARAAAEGAVRVIVELDVATWPEGELPGAAARLAQRQAIAAAQSGLAAELRGESHQIKRPFRTIPFLALVVGPGALAALARSGWVIGVEEDRLHRPMLDVSVPLVEADQAAALGLDGFGQTIAVLDTGVDANHDNLAGKMVAEACFAGGDPFGSGACPNGATSDTGPGSGSYCTFSSECSHGTHVTGIALGDGASFPGVARAANFVSIQVHSMFSGFVCGAASPCPLSWASDQIAALEHVYDPLRFQHTIAAVNMSLGGITYTSQPTCDLANEATKAAIDNLRSVGIATVIAAGSNGLDDAISEPGCISSAVSVSATDDNDQVAGSANAASFLDLWAPGTAIVAPLYQTTSSFTEESGASMATAHVSGAWAILRQDTPTASVDEILMALQDSGVPIAHINAVTTRIRIKQALDLDTDADGKPDLTDNCKFRANAGQADTDLDGVGDVCQCGDMNGDGNIDGTDRVLYLRDFGGLPSPFSVDRCGVKPAPSMAPNCDGTDLVIIKRHFGGLPPFISNTCSAFVGP